MFMFFLLVATAEVELLCAIVGVRVNGSGHLSKQRHVRPLQV